MTTLLVFSDIHANLEALQAVLDHAQQSHARPDHIWCLGDIVGYGPDPGACIDLLRGGHPLTSQSPTIVVKGNHDLGTIKIGQHQSDDTTSAAVRESWDWTYQILSEEQRRYLDQLPEQLIFTDLPQSVLLVHAAPPNDLNTYLRVPADVEARLHDLQQRICFFGHTHLACYFECDRTRHEVKPRLFPANAALPVQIQSDAIFINPGTVGQPRWGRLRSKTPEQLGYPLRYEGVREASYLWVDLQADRCLVQCHYVSYSYQQTISKMQRLASQSPALSVPQRWITRLDLGLR